MPLYHSDTIFDDAKYGIWDIEEDESYFLQFLNLDAKGQKRLDSLKGHRRLEWLSSRCTLQHLCDRPLFFCIDKYGKPFIKHEQVHISLSHSHNRVAAVIAPHSCGIDIQKKVDKIARIKHKFVNADEAKWLQNHDELDGLHIIWGAKEAMYKAYGKRSLDFKEQIRLFDIETLEKEGFANGIVLKNDLVFEYKVHYQFVDDFVLVNVIQL